MNTDLPLSNIREDKLGRAIFAKEIANGLVKSFETNNESIVVGINGSWGSGKSTLVNFIISEIEQISTSTDQEIITISFNPWMFSGQRELQNIFLKELFSKLAKNKAKFKGASEKIADFLGHLNWLKYVHSGTGELVKDSKEFLEGLSKGKDLDDLKKEIDKLLIKSKVKLYITIDDIDRLLPHEVTDIFQLVKLNGNFANTIFLLAYDREVVGAALEKQFGENGGKYIEKIIQVDYTLPNVSKEVLSKILFDKLELLFPDGEIKNSINNISENLKNSKFTNYFKTLRDVYRFTNSIKIRLASVYAELNLFEYFLIEALRVFDYKAFEFISNNKEIFIYRKLEAPYGFKDDNKDLNKILENQNFDQNTVAVIKSIFVIDNYYSTIDSQDLIREKRAANINYFDRYFSLQLSSNDVPEKTFNQFLFDYEILQKVEILKRIKHESKLFTFLNWSEIKGRQLDERNTASILEASVIFLNSLSFKREFLWAFDAEYMIVIRFISGLIGNLETPEIRQEIMLKKLNCLQEDQFALFWLCDTILHAFHQFKEGKLNSNYLWYFLFPYGFKLDNCAKFIKEIEKKHKSCALNLFNKEISDRYLNDDELNAILETVSSYDSKLYSKKFPLLLNDDQYLLRLIWLCMKKAFVESANGIGYQLASYQFFKGLDPKKVKSRFENLDLDLLDKDEKKIVDIFNKAYDDGFLKGAYYDFKTLAKSLR